MAVTPGARGEVGQGHLKTVQAAVNKAVEAGGGAEKKGSKAHNVEDRVSPWGNLGKTIGKP